MYLDPIVSDDLVLDMIRGELSLSLKLSVYWQDIRLITRCVILLMLIIMKMMKIYYLRQVLFRTLRYFLKNDNDKEITKYIQLLSKSIVFVRL